MTDQSDNQFSVHPSTLGKMILIDHCFGASNQFGDSHSSVSGMSLKVCWGTFGESWKFFILLYDAAGFDVLNLMQNP